MAKLAIIIIEAYYHHQNNVLKLTVGCFYSAQ